MSTYKYPSTYDWDLIGNKFLASMQKYSAYTAEQEAEIRRLFAEVAAKAKGPQLAEWINGLDYTCSSPMPYAYKRVVQQIDRKHPGFAFGSASFVIFPKATLG